MVHFIESCYDDATACCDKSVYMKPKNAFLALHLGELDGFPMALYRFISRTYSVLTVRHKICLEMLVTLEAIMMSGERTSPSFGMTHLRAYPISCSSETSHVLTALFIQRTSDTHL